MIYLGHFSCFSPDEPDRVRCYMTCVVEADDHGQALDRFRDLLRRQHEEKGGIFPEMDRVFLDSATEIRSMPAGGFISYALWPSAHGNGSINVSAVGVKESEAVAFDTLDEEADTVEPFVSFGARTT